jgi:hypothetical protein
MRKRIFIECTGHGQTGAHYRVTGENGRVLVARSRVPEFDAARVLLAEGVTGELEIWRPAGTSPAMRLDIGKAAEHTVVEGATIGPVIRRWTADNRRVAGEEDDDRPGARL